MSQNFIGDIHGHAERLEALLTELGYARRRGAWRHPDRTAVFVGDFIDRGPQQLRTLEIVRAMVDAGSAEAVMGNHEFNAIGFATPDPQASGEHLRPRSTKNARQHAAFPSEVGCDSAVHRSWVDWFLTLPLCIEEPGFRVVHACWEQRVVTQAHPWLGDSRRLAPGLLSLAFKPGNPLSECAEVLLKGPEIELPQGATFTDKEGHVRTAIRTRWWAPELATYDAAYVGPAGACIPAFPLPTVSNTPEPDRPTFIGHYWLEPDGGPALLSRRVACVDYSVAKGGLMTAYRFAGEAVLTPEHFVSV